MQVLFMTIFPTTMTDLASPRTSAYARLIVSALTAALLGAAQAQAQTTTNFYFDANGTTNGVGGTGNWTATNTNNLVWTTDSTGLLAPANILWTNGFAWSNNLANNAIFEGTAGTVSLSASSVFANQILVNVPGYILRNSSTGTSSANRYFRTRGGIVLADGVDLNVSSGVTTNGAITGFEGPIVGVNGTTAVSTGSSITVTGTTANADSSVRLGFDTAASDIWVPVNVATTGNGYALFMISSSGVTNSIYGNVAVTGGSRLVLGGSNSSTTRRINVRGNLTTTNTDLTVGETGHSGTIGLYGTNSIGGNVILNSGRLGYGSKEAFGSSTVVISNGTTFGQIFTIGTTDEERTITNNISLLGNVTFGLGTYGNYFAGNFNLNNGSRTVTLGNSTTIGGSVTNGSMVLSNTSATRAMTFNGDLNLSAFTNLSAGTTLLNGNTTIANLVVSNGVVLLGTGSNNIPGIVVNGGSLGAADLGSGNLVLQGIGATAVLSNSAASGSLPVGPVSLSGSGNISMSTDGSATVASSGVVTLSGASNGIVLTGSILANGATYTLLTGTSLATNGLTGPVTLTGSGVNNAAGIVLNGPAITSGQNIYTFRTTATSLEVQVDQNPALDLTWNGGSSGTWNTNSANTNWSDSGTPTAFASGNNAIIDTATNPVSLTLAPGGITAGYVTVSGTNGASFSGGNLTAIALASTDADLTVNSSCTLTNLVLTNASVAGSGTITTSAGTTVQNDTDESIGAVLAGTGGLTKSGTGILSLSAANSFAGDAVVNGGTLATAAAGVLPDSSTVRLAVAGTALDLGGNETVAAVSAANETTINVNAFNLTMGGTGASFTNTAAISGTGGIVKNGGGLLWLNNANSTYSGGLTLNGGELAFTASGSYGIDGVSTSVFGTGTLTLNGGILRSSSPTSGRNIANDIVVNENVQFGAVGGEATVTMNATAGKTTTLTKSLTITTVGSVVWEQPLSGSGLTLTKAGTNELQLRGATTLSGLLAAQGDLIVRGSNNFTTVRVDNGARLGYGSTNAAASAYFGGGAIVLSNGATLGQFATNGTGTEAERILPNNISILGNVTFGLGGFASYFGGALDLNAGSRTVTLSNSTYLNGVVSNGGLVVSNTSSTRTLYLNGNNSYTGGTVQNGGVISLGHDRGLGSGSLTVNAGTNDNTLTISANRTVTNAILLTGDAMLAANTAAMTNTPFIWTQNGVISGVGSLTKSGEGTLILAAANSHVGTNSVAAGTLVLGNAAALGSSNNPLNLNGGMFQLAQSSGDVRTGTLSVSSNAVVDLGAGSPSRVVRFGGLAITTATLTVSNTANGSVYFPTNVSDNAAALAQIKSADTTNAAVVNAVTGLLSFPGGGAAPSGLFYTPSSVLGTVGTAITTIVPTVTGTVTNYSVSPALPTGLAINAITGDISGTPTATSPSVTYTVTAANDFGATTANVTISVQSGYAAWSGGAPLDSTNLLKYAIGGASSISATNGVAPTSATTSSNISITAIVRTNDPSLAVFGQSILNLATGTWITNDVTMTPGDQIGVGQGLQRQIWSTPRTNDTKKFLRLRSTYSQ